MPIRARLAHIVVRASNKLARATDSVRALLDELPLAVYTPRVEQKINKSYYARNAEYVSDDHARRGLLLYEKQALERFFPSPPAHVLVYGAGGGRETVELLRCGYTVDAHEPVAEMVEVGNRQLAEFGEQINQLSLQEWAVAPTGTYDAIFTGWAMWTHIMRHDERGTALRAFRNVYASGPLLLSFLRPAANFDEAEPEAEAEPLHPEPRGGAQRLVRGLLRRRLLRRPPLERGTAWDTGSYVHQVSEAELREEAALSGWTLAYHEGDFRRYGYAVLLPAASDGGAT